MSQLALFVALHLLGVVVGVAIGPWRRIWLCSALGFLVGLAVMVLLSIGPLLLGVYKFGVMAALYAAILGMCVRSAVKSGRWTRSSVHATALSAVGFAALCVPFCYWNFSSFSYDSHMFVLYGHVLGHDGELTFQMLERLHAWGVFQVIAHALGAFVKQDYLYGLAPAFAISMLAAFAVMLNEALHELRVSGRQRALWIALAVAVLLAMPLFRFHVVYIHANMPSAGYLMCFLGLFWLAELREDTAYASIAFVALLAFTLLRVEAVPYAITFLIPTVIVSQLARGTIRAWYGLYTAALVVWFTLLAVAVPEDSVYLTPAKCALFGTALALLFAYWLVRDRWWFRRLTPRVPHLALALCGLGVIAAYVDNGDTMRLSGGIWLSDLWRSPWWASIWKWTTLLTVVGVFVPAPPRAGIFVYCVGLFFGLTLIVASQGSAFGGDIDGSLIRMTIHIVPVVFFYGVLKFAPLLNATRQRYSASGTRNSGASGSVVATNT